MEAKKVTCPVLPEPEYAAKAGGDWPDVQGRFQVRRCVEFTPKGGTEPEHLVIFRVGSSKQDFLCTLAQLAGYAEKSGVASELRTADGFFNDKLMAVMAKRSLKIGRLAEAPVPKDKAVKEAQAKAEKEAAKAKAKAEMAIA